MSIAKFGAVIITGVMLMVGAHAPAFAASIATNVLLNNIVPNVDFLDRSSRMATANSKNPRVKAYALGTAKEQTLAANAVDAWIEADKRPVVADASDTAPIVTGRSAAVEGPQAADMRLPMGQEDLDRIEGLEGKDFDDLYKAKQLDALTQVQQSYEDYLARGDDPVLRKVAAKELPRIKQRLAMLKKL